MRRILKIAMALVCLGAISGASTKQEREGSKSAPSPQPQTIKIAAPQDVSFPKEYRYAVLQHMAQGETVSVPIDKIGYLEGTVRLVPYRHAQPAGVKASVSVPKTTEGDLSPQIEVLAGRMQDPVAKEGLKSFAQKGSSDEKMAFFYLGRPLDLLNYTTGPALVKAASQDSQKNCYDSCETLCHVACHQACTWDCSIVNGERVCTESCSTICPEVCNVVCHRVCN